jgi:hypothetical protein
MRLILYPLALILWATPALGAIVNVGSLGTGGTSGAGTTITITTSATLEQHNYALIRIGADNFGTASGSASEVSSVVDSAGNTYARICEYRYSEGVAGDGALIALWGGRAASALSSGGTFTITFGNSIGSRVAQAQEFNIVDGDTLQIAGTCQTENINGTDAGSLAISGLASKEYMFIRAIAWEAGGGAISAETATYATVTGVSIDTGVNATSMTTDAERLIATATGSTSDPTISANVNDGASIFVALEECTPGTNCTGDAVAAPTGQLRRRSN